MATLPYLPYILDPDSTYSVSSTGTALPAWVSLNPGTGELTGTPGPGDIGVVTTGHVLTVFDGTTSVPSNAFSITVTGAVPDPNPEEFTVAIINPSPSGFSIIEIAVLAPPAKVIPPVVFPTFDINVAIINPSPQDAGIIIVAVLG